MLNSLATWSPWSAPFVPWTASRTKMTMPVYDLTEKRANFSSNRKHIRPLPAPSENFSFSAWRLAHAVKKAECTRPIATTYARMTALGFLLENGHLFEWSSANLRLAEDAISLLDDFSRTSLAGRIAQGMAMLQMEAQGYAFVDRFSTFSKRNGVTLVGPTKGKKFRRLKAPDFVFETTPTSRALVEAKGGFVSEDALANIKGELAGALDQLENWGNQFNPAITKKFAIGTFIREVNDPHAEPSLIAVVDPEGGQDPTPTDVPPDSVRRANYASWLRGMGYLMASRRLMGASDNGPREISFLVDEILGKDYAIVPIGLISRYDSNVLTDVRDFRDWIFDPSYTLHRFALHGGVDLAVAAINFDILKLVGRASVEQRGDALLAIRPGESSDIGEIQNDSGTIGSLFADGSFIGQRSPDRWLKSPSRIEKIKF